MTSVTPYLTTNCPHCGMIHQTTCPRIKAIEYENGMIKRIEFHELSPARLDYAVRSGAGKTANPR